MKQAPKRPPTSVTHLAEAKRMLVGRGGGGGGGGGGDGAAAVVVISSIAARVSDTSSSTGYPSVRRSADSSQRLRFFQKLSDK